MTDKFVRATPAAAGGQLTGAQIASWREQGFALVGGLLPEALVLELRAAARARFPAPDDPRTVAITDFGSAGAFTFVSDVAIFNAVTLHPHIMDAAARLLDLAVEDLRLSQSDLWPKYGRRDSSGDKDNSDQRMHVDYPNHTLVHPPPWDRPEAVEMILYLDHADDCGGATAVVARTGQDDPAYRWPIVDSPGIGDLRYLNDRTSAERYFAEMRPALAVWRQSLYEREQYARYRPGDILFYRHDTWHRGTPLEPGRLRLAHNMTWRKATSEWVSTLHTGWAWSAYHDDKFLEKLIAGASLVQRAVMGFPQPGSDYWCEQTIAAAEARYGMYGFDATPYRQAQALQSH